MEAQETMTQPERPILKLDVGKGLPMYFTCETVKRNIGNVSDYEITFAHDKPIEVGDALGLGHKCFEIKEINERRKAAGNYPEGERPDFYRVTCSVINDLKKDETKK